MDAEPPTEDPVLDLVTDYFVSCSAGREPSLDALCAARPELRKRVAYAIAESLRMDRLLSGGGRTASPPAAGVARRFADLRPVAHGGMGEVFRATDLEAAREVAYKVVHPRLNCGLFREYLLSEGRLTAALSHPAIVPVYAVVQDDCGRPAYAMEFIAGETVHDAVARHHASPRSPDAAARLRTLVGHVVAVCRAVAYAHANGITHGDIKANNVRIRTDGKPFVIDWGLARRHPDGVPAAAAAADTDRLARLLADVLGSVGVPPALAATRAAALAGRYASADALGDAVQLWLDTGGTPDYRDYWTVRAVRWANRRKATATAVVAGLLLALVSALAVLQLRSERRAAAAREDAAELERARADNERLQAEKAAAAAVRDTIGQAEVVGRFQAAVTGGRKLLADARSHLAHLAAAAEREPHRAGEAADLYRRCGKLAFNLDDSAGAASDYDHARRLAEAALASADGPADRVRLAAILREWGVTRAVRWQTADARAAWDRASRLLQTPTGPLPEGRFILAQLHMVRGNVAATPAAKRDLYAQARRLIEELLAEKHDKADDFRHRFTLAEILNNCAHQADEDAAERERNCVRAVALWRALVEEQPERPETKAYLAASLNHLGNACQLLVPPKLEEAESWYRDAKTIYQSLILAFPGVASNHEELNHVEAGLKKLAARRVEAKR